MSIATEESDDAMLSKAQSGFSPYDEGNSGENMSRGFGLKKGPWTSAEDAILVEYVKRHGEGNWNAVQKQSGLLRCGKSCRLRWANHLRPNLKKGTFTADEERLIIELHAKMGNKWARMAARLPGRTDNEIKNYWNTRVKRRQRAGLPLYPPEVYLQVMQENESLNTSGSYRGVKTHHGLLQTNCYEVAGFDFNGLKANRGLLPYAPELPDLSESNFLMKGLGSSQYSSFVPPIMHRQVQFQDTVNLFSSNDEDVSNGLLQLDLIQDGPRTNDEHNFGLSFPYDPDPSTNYHFPFETLQGSQSLINGNFSASKSTPGTVKLELPSLQYPETGLGNCGTSALPPPLLEPVDTYMQSESSTTRNSGLLDAVLHESMNLGSAKNHSSDKSSDSSTVTPRELADSPTMNLCETEWEEYSESISAFGHSASATSIFSECTHMSRDRSSLNEHTPAETFLGGIVKSEPVDQVWTPEGEREISTRFSSPDALLESDWIEKIAGCNTKEQTCTNDPIAMLLGGDHGSDYRHMAFRTSTSSQMFELP